MNSEITMSRERIPPPSSGRRAEARCDRRNVCLSIPSAAMLRLWVHFVQERAVKLKMTGAQHSAVQVAERLGAGLPGECSSEIRVLEHPQDLPRERTGIIRGDQEAGYPVFNPLVEAPDPGRDHGQPTRHALGNCDRSGFWPR